MIILVIMGLLFRSLTVGLLFMVPNLIALVMTICVMGILGIRLRTSTLLILSAPSGLAVDGAMRFLARQRRERAARNDASQAMGETLRSTERPFVCSIVLLAGGFWTFLLSSFNATRYIGLRGGATLISAVVAQLVVLPSDAVAATARS